MRDFVFLAEDRQRRRARHRLRQASSRRVHIDPNVPIALFARIMPRENALHLQLVLRSQRRNLHATRRASIEPPPVITAFHSRTIKVTVRKRYPAMRTRIPHSKRLALRSPPHNQRHLQQHSRNQLVAATLPTPHRRIPKIPEKPSIVTRLLLHRHAISLQNVAYRFAHALSDTAGNSTYCHS